MGVVDVRRRDEGVQQRLDRGARRGRVQLAAGEVGDHVLVAHLVALHQRQDLVEAQGVKSEADIVARSLPEPLTQMAATSRPT